jgi:hypothetical protein
MTSEPKPVGTAWPCYRPGALAEVQPSSATITTFVLVDVVTGQPFNRPAGTTGADDTPLSQPVGLPAPAPTTGQAPALDIDGPYLFHILTDSCPGNDDTDRTQTVTHQGNTLTIASPTPVGTSIATGTLNADRSFSLTNQFGFTQRGVFATEGGRTVIRDGTWELPHCGGTWTATKQ